MKIKLAILECDKNYLTRLITAFAEKYAEKLELYSFTDRDMALETLNTARIDVLLSNDAFDIDIGILPNRCGFAYLVDSTDIQRIKGQQTICKYQKADLMYKAILSLYSEKASAITGFGSDEDKSKFIAFCSAAGGVGSSTMAAACAIHYAQAGYKTLYLNLEHFGSSEVFFHGQGQFSLSDIIYNLKSKKTNLNMKLESCVKQDPSGVFYFSEPNISLDRLEMHAEELQQLISEIKRLGEYDYVVVDMEFGLDRDTMVVFRCMHVVIMVGDGSAQSNMKTERAYEAMCAIEQNAEVPLTNRLCFVYNRVNSKMGTALNIHGIRQLGGTPRYEGAAGEQLLQQLAKQELFDKIL